MTTKDEALKAIKEIRDDCDTYLPGRYLHYLKRDLDAVEDFVRQMEAN